MLAADFAEKAMNTAAAIIIAGVFILLLLFAFKDMIFGLLAGIRDSWNAHMRR